MQKMQQRKDPSASMLVPLRRTLTDLQTGESYRISGHSARSCCTIRPTSSDLAVALSRIHGMVERPLQL